MRELAGRADFLCCLKPNPNVVTCTNKPYKHKQFTPVEKFFGDILPKIILHPIGKMAVVAGTIALTVTSAYYSNQVASRFNDSWFIPPGYVKDALDLRTAEFGGRFEIVSFITGDVNYPSLSVQQALDSMSQDMLASPYVVSCNDNFWPFFQTWMQQEKSGQVLTVDGRTYAASADFYDFLDEFLNSASGARFVSQVRILFFFL